MQEPWNAPANKPDKEHTKSHNLFGTYFVGMCSPACLDNSVFGR